MQRFLNPKKINPGIAAAERDPSGALEVAKLGFVSDRLNRNSNSRQLAISQAQKDIISSAEEALGSTVTPEMWSGFSANRQSPHRYNQYMDSFGFSREDDEAEYISPMEAKLRAIQEMKEADPEKFEYVPNISEIDEIAKAKARMAEKDYQMATMYTSGFKGAVGGLAGGFAAAGTDPINIAASAFGVGVSSGIIRAILASAAANVVTEATIQPFVYQWQNEVGNPYGFREVSINLGFAALFGGSISAVAKGARPSAQWVFGKASELPVPASAKQAFKYMSRVAHTKESNPHFRSATVAQRQNHIDSLSATAKSFYEGRKLQPDELKITEAEFRAIDTDEMPTDTKIQREIARQIREVQQDDPLSKSEINSLRPDYSLESIPQQVLERFMKKGAVRRADFQPEELHMLDSAGIRPSKNGQYAKKPLRDELESRAKNDEIIDTTGIENNHIDDFKTLWNENLKKAQDVNLEEKHLLDGIHEKEISRPIAEDIQPSSDVQKISQQMQEKTNEKAFETLVNESPEMRIVNQDGVEMSLKDLMNEFKNDQKVVSAITRCAI